MPKPFLKLRHRMDEMDVDLEYIAPRLIPPRNVDYVRNRLNAHRPWTTDDMKVLISMLHIKQTEVIPMFIPELEEAFQ